MIQTNLAFKDEESFELIPEWKYFVSEISKVFRFTEEETSWLTNCKTAQLIATIPFAANCIEPERTAIAHLCIYIAEIKGFQKYCAHQPSDDFDIYNRLAFISTFEGGNKKIIEEGMSLLALIMLEGYHKTLEEDKMNKKYNPLINGTWDYNKIKKTLYEKIYNSNNYFSYFLNEGLETWD